MVPTSRKAPAEPAAPQSIIVLAREHIGDLVCTTPALRSLRNLYPLAHIAVEAGEQASSVFQNSPAVDEVIVRPRHQGLAGKANFVRLLRRMKYSLGIILDDSPDMALHLWLGGVPVRAGIVRRPRFARLLNLPVPYDASAHEMVDNFLNVVGALGGNIENRRPEMFPGPRDVERVCELMEATGLDGSEPVLALNPGASASANRWPPEYFARLGDLLQDAGLGRVALLGGPGDDVLAREIVRGMRSAPIVLTGRLTLHELYVVLGRCAIMITGDTGPMHMAAGAGTPILGLFGPADPVESGPGYVPRSRVLRHVTGCSECTKSQCRRNQHCMRLIKPEEAAEAALSLLSIRETRIEF